MEAALGLAAVLLLVAANGFFVATEFALVSVRRTRIEQLVAEGRAAARSALDAINHLDTYIAATQLGITIASLALGWIGEPALSHLLEPLVLALPVIPPDARTLVSHSLSAAIAFIVITSLHIVLGELAPKSIALQRAESTAMLVAVPIHWFLAVFRLPIHALNSVGNGVVRALGFQPAAGHALVQSAEELKLSVAASREAGLVSDAAKEVVNRALDFAKLAAHHVMVPRTEMVALPANAPLQRVIEVIEERQHSRYPVFDGDVDNIIGVVSAARLMAATRTMPEDESQRFDLRRFASPPLFVPETTPAYELLARMRRERSHIAIVVDEYGVTAGLVALRAIVDRIAGEIPDETEVELPMVQRMPDGSVVVDGLALVADVEAELGIDFDDTDYDTLGGYIFGRLGRRPTVDDTVLVNGELFVVEELDGLRVSRVRVSAVPVAERVPTDASRATGS
ncbi:MAG: DUF21 domain-containing protein [Chloroflexi bacterium]|nr:DUF21 domain-containing protein [Chloroflexota bacterium]